MFEQTISSFMLTKPLNPLATLLGFYILPHHFHILISIVCQSSLLENPHFTLLSLLSRFKTLPSFTWRPPLHSVTPTPPPTMAHRSQSSSVGDNPLDPNYLPPHYREEYRLAIDALIEDDSQVIICIWYCSRGWKHGTCVSVFMSVPPGPICAIHRIAQFYQFNKKCYICSLLLYCIFVTSWIHLFFVVQILSSIQCVIQVNEKMEKKLHLHAFEFVVLFCM